MMIKEKTTEERAGFAAGVLNIVIFRIGWSSFKEESWLTYLGFFLMIFAAVMALKYMMPSKNTKADITLHNSPFKKPNKDE